MINRIIFAAFATLISFSNTANAIFIENEIKQNILITADFFLLPFTKETVDQFNYDFLKNEPQENVVCVAPDCDSAALSIGASHYVDYFNVGNVEKIRVFYKKSSVETFVVGFDESFPVAVPDNTGDLIEEVVVIPDPVKETVIVPSANSLGHITFLPGNTDTPAVLKIPKPSQSGASLINFDDFSVHGSGLKLVNLESDETPAAKLIVIQSSKIELTADIEISGIGADLVFITDKDDGDISCTNCSFVNVYRLSLLSAKRNSSTTSDASELGVLNSNNEGILKVNGLFAPGALAIDLLAKQLSITGLVKSNQQVSKDIFGGYRENINGDLVMGVGSVNVLTGGFDWDYENQSIQKVYKNDSYVEMTGRIESAAVKINSANYLKMNTEIDTRVDALSTIRYKGETFMADGSVTIRSFAGTAPAAGLNMVNTCFFMGGCSSVMNEAARFQSHNVSGLDIGANVFSEGVLVFESVESLRLLGKKKITAANISLVAGDILHNTTDIDADNIDVSARHIANSGVIQGVDTLNAWAEIFFVNEYGGKFLGADVVLHADYSFRNGALLPYKYKVPEKEYMFSIFGPPPKNLNSKNDVGVPPGLFGVVEPFLNTGLINFYTSHAGQGQFGLYYTSSLGGGSDRERFRVNDTTAQIVGGNVEVISPRLVNMNAFWIDNTSALGIVSYPQDKLSQVVISAENNLLINSENYLINSSAVLGVSGDEGVMEINAARIFNERYRVANSLRKKSDYTTDTVDVVSVLYSPPGVITSFGDLNVTAATQLKNDFSYIEVFGDASLKTPSFHDMGMKFRSLGKDHMNRYYNCQYASLSLGFSNVPRQPCGVIKTDKPPVYSDSSINIDSLLFVHGELKGEKASYYVSDYNPLHYMVNVDWLIKGALIRDGITSSSVGTMRTCLSLVCLGSLSPGTDYMYRTNTSSIYTTGMISVSVNKKASGTSYTSFKTVEFSFIDEILKVFDVLKNKLETFYDNEDWWGPNAEASEI